METDKPMDPVTISALIGAGSGLVGGLINNSYQDAKSDEQWARTLYMQDKMNAYNSPKNQMKLLREAGLNPNLVYAHGGAVMQSAGGNAPPPPNSAPLDTQAVLQMVQTVVQGMLEKDKIQANKDLQGQSIQSQERMQDKSIQSQAGMQDKSIQSQERMQDKSIQSQAGMQDKSIQSQERMQDKSIQSQERMLDKQLSEKSRQFDLSFEHQRVVDSMRISIDRALADSQVSLHDSQIKINELSAQLSEKLEPFLVDKAKLEVLQSEFSLQNGKLDTFFSRPFLINSSDVEKAYKDAGLPVPTDFQMSCLIDYHNAAVRVWNQSLSTQKEQLSDQEFYSGWMHFWNAASSASSVAGSAAATVILKK